MGRCHQREAGLPQAVLPASAAVEAAVGTTYSTRLEDAPKQLTWPLKAMGPTKIPGAQDILLAARDALDCGQVVPVEVVPGPDTPKDNRAITFQCLLKGQLHTFGYGVFWKRSMVP